MNITIKTPYPISTNRYYFMGKDFKTKRSIMLISKDGAVFKQTVQWENCRVKPIAEDVKLDIIVHPKLSKKGLAYKSLIDLDNSLKCILDSLIGRVYHDDKQVKCIAVEYGPAIINGGATVNVSKYLGLKFTTEQIIEKFVTKPEDRAI